MQFQSETNGLDLYSDARSWCGIDETSDTTTYPIKAFTRNANRALDRVTTLILKADGAWKWDDANQSDLPVIVTDLVSGQADYSLAVSYLKVNRIRIKDSAGNYTVLPQVASRQLSDAQLDSTSGTPTSCEIYGNSVLLYPAPSYASTSGLELQIQRPASYFAYDSTAKTPGFAPQFHTLISLWAALDYCEMNHKADRAAALRLRIGSPPDLLNNQAGSGMEKELVDFYASRNEGMPITLRPRYEDYGQSGLSAGTGTYPTSNNPHGF